MAKIMVVDDEASVRNLLKEILSDSEYDILEAGNGQEACDILSQTKIDLVVTDLVMPDKSGLELIMDLMDTNPGLPIIAISGGGGITGRFDYLPIAKLIGASKIVKKPFKIDEIRKLILGLLQERLPG